MLWGESFNQDSKLNTLQLDLFNVILNVDLFPFARFEQLFHSYLFAITLLDFITSQYTYLYSSKLNYAIHNMTHGLEIVTCISELFTKICMMHVVLNWLKYKEFLLLLLIKNRVGQTNEWSENIENIMVCDRSHFLLV